MNRGCNELLQRKLVELVCVYTDRLRQPAMPVGGDACMRRRLCVCQPIGGNSKSTRTVLKVHAPPQVTSGRAHAADPYVEQVSHSLIRALQRKHSSWQCFLNCCISPGAVSVAPRSVVFVKVLQILLLVPSTLNKLIDC